MSVDFTAFWLHSKCMVWMTYNVDARRAIRLAEALLLSILIVVIAVLPAAAANAACCAGDHPVLAYQSDDCMTDAGMTDHTEQMAQSVESGKEAAMSCMYVIGNAVGTHAAATPVLMRTLLGTGKWSLENDSLPSLALSGQDRPPRIS
ncbi:hypothetical protein [Roseovarius nanhaiticus]|uniref:hypothetical protein n=1 Tax=Roseovarius nanhaiticus TaxID=573024 RepID=UPI00249248B9|nr:hypothetical protein [Roseovarius nanhaiticus]